MTYRLKYDAEADAVHDSLPQPVSQELSLRLAAACDDPLGETAPFGEPDDVMRRVITPHVVAVLLLGHAGKTITVLRIRPLR